MDDERDSDDWDRDDREDRDDRDDRDDRNDRDDRRGRRNGRNHRNHRDRDYDGQVIFAEKNDNGNGNNGQRDRDRYECNIDLNDDNRRQEIMQRCCEEEADGRLDQNNQRVSLTRSLPLPFPC